MNKMIKLNLNTPEHQSYFQNLYEGIDLEKQLPNFFELYQETVAQHAIGIGLDYPTYNDIGIGFQDGIDIECVSYSQDRQILHVQAVTSLRNKANFIDECLELYTSDGMRLKYIRKSSSVVKSSGISASFELKDLPETIKMKELEIRYTVVWSSMVDPGMKALMLPYYVLLDSYGNNCVEEVDLEFPKHIKTPKDSAITVCYGRWPSEMVVDKVYDLIYTTHQPSLLLDFCGNVKLISPLENPFDFIDINSFELKVNCNSGFAVYRQAYQKDGRIIDRTQDIINSFTATADGFHFELNNDWKEQIPTMSLPAQDDVTLSFRVCFIMKNGRKGILQILSQADNSALAGSNIKKISKLKLLWGCLAEGSLIKLVDGTEKRIEEIQIGDRVLSYYTGASSKVVNCWVGVEHRPLVCIQAVNGAQIYCTSSHPIITTEGVVLAIDVTRDHLLLDTSGKRIAIGEVFFTSSDYTKVYNLSLEPEENDAVVYVDSCPVKGTTMYCNGLLVGDNEMQNHSIIASDKSQLDMKHIRESKLKQRLFELNQC